MIEVIGRQLKIPDGEVSIGQMGDSQVEKRVFFLPAQYGTADLTALTWRLETSIKGTTNIILLDKDVSDGLKLTWNIEKSHVLIAGHMYIQLRGYADGGEVWHSSQEYVVVRSSINATGVMPSPLPSEFEEYEKRIDAAVKDAEAVKGYEFSIDDAGNLILESEDL